MRFRHGLTAVLATVFAVGALGACSDGAKDVVEAAGRQTTDASSMRCDDPAIPMGEWRKRCASDEPSDTADDGGGTGSVKPSSGASAPDDDDNTPSATAKAPSSGAKVGDTIAVTGDEGEKFEVTLVRAVDPATSSNPYSTPAPGNRLIALQWRVTNTGTAVVEPSPSYETTLIDVDGQSFRSTYVSTTAGVVFPSSAQIPPGESRLGFITYEAPADAKIVKVEYDASYEKPPASWQLG